jgi:hypothetical protein
VITLQFVRGADFGADAISWFGHGADFSHVDTVTRGGLLGARSDVVGGAPAGVHVRDPSYVAGARALLRVDLPCSPEVAAAYEAFLTAQIGLPYDSEGILAFVVGRDWRGPGAWFCSELVGAGLEASGYFPYPLATPANKLTPPDLLLALSTINRIDPKAITVPPPAPVPYPMPHEKEPS